MAVSTTVGSATVRPSSVAHFSSSRGATGIVATVCAHTAATFRAPLAVTEARLPAYAPK